MNITFSDSILETEFRENGYVIYPVISKEDIITLFKIFNDFEKQYIQPFHTSHFSTDKNYKQQVNDSITAILFPQLKLLLNNYRPVFGNWMVKKGQGSNAMPLHADWTYVDESKYRSVSVWIPLIDTDEPNGCYGLIAGSHRISPGIRGPRIIQGNWQNFDKWILAKGQLIPMKAGEALIYDHALLHFSPANVSGKIRPALNLSCSPIAAQLYHYCIPEGTSNIRKYRVDDLSFFIHYDNFQIPESGVVEEYITEESLSMIDESMEAFIAV